MHMFVYVCTYGSFCKLGLPSVSVLTIRALLLGVYVRVPDCWKLPCEP